MDALADLRDLSVFGVKPGGDWGVIVVSTAAVLTQLYWYVLRYLHMKEDALMEQEPLEHGESRIRLKISPNNSFKRKSGDLLSNWVCFLLTVSSWYFAFSWIFDASFDRRVAENRSKKCPPRIPESERPNTRGACRARVSLPYKHRWLYGDTTQLKNLLGLVLPLSHIQTSEKS